MNTQQPSRRQPPDLRRRFKHLAAVRPASAPSTPAAAPAVPAVPGMQRPLAPAAPPGEAPTLERLLVQVGVTRAAALDAMPAAAGPEWAVKWLGSLGGGGVNDTWAEVVVVAASLAELRRAAPWLLRAGRADRVVLWVSATDRPDALYLPLGVPGAEVLAGTVERSAGPEGALVATTVAVTLSRPVGVHVVARAALTQARGGGGAPPCAGLRLGLTSADALAWAAGDPSAVLVRTRVLAENELYRRSLDLLVGPESQDDSPLCLPRLDLAERFALPPVDTTVLSPRGFRRDAGPDAGRLVLADGAKATAFCVLDPQGVEVVVGDLRAGLTEAHVHALRAFRLVDVEVEGAPDAAVGRLLTQLTCAGVPVRAAGLSARLIDALGPELATRVLSLGDTVAGDPLARESWSVDLRRLALARFAPQRFWAGRASEFGLPAAALPQVSVLLATRRAECVPFALAQVERQDWPQVETVLILHGVPASEPRVAAAVAAFSRPIVVVEVETGTVFGNALNAGVARCSGRLVAKMDDDDWYGPHHLTDLVQAHTHSGATLVGASAYFTYLGASGLTVRWSPHRTESRADAMLGGTMLLAAEDLLGVGGFRALHRWVDRYLRESVRAAGGTFYSTHDLGFLYYRGRDHTWNPEQGDAYWLANAPEQYPGFFAPPQVHPLVHPSSAVGSPAEG